MITFEEARGLALSSLAEMEAAARKRQELQQGLTAQERRTLGIPTEETPFELVLLDKETIDHEFGWVFFYQSKAYLESGRPSEALAGNAPILVSRKDGTLHVTGTALPIETYIENFKRTGDPHLS